MQEMTIAKPLTGPEIIEAICFKMRESLSKNCLLAGHQAYAGFSFDAKVELHFNNPASYVKEAMGFAKGSDGDTTPTEGDLSDTVVMHEPEASPNEVRRETEQPVPAIATSPSGKKEEVKLKYQRKKSDAPRV